MQACVSTEFRVHDVTIRHGEARDLEGANKSQGPLPAGAGQLIASHHANSTMATLQEVLGGELSAPVIIGRHRGVPLKPAHDQDVGHAPLLQFIGGHVAQVRVADDDPVDASGEHRIDADLAMSGVVPRIGNDRSITGLTGSQVDAVVDRGEPEVGQPRHEYADEAGGASSQARSPDIPLIAQGFRQLAHPTSGVGSDAARIVAEGP